MNVPYIILTSITSGGYISLLCRPPYIELFVFNILKNKYNFMLLTNTFFELDVDNIEKEIREFYFLENFDNLFMTTIISLNKQVMYSQFLFPSQKN